jgi:DNA polymerase III sliding clamp (beta) subunit (PCNA family)
MLKELKFVQGAVAKKDFLPALTHFCVENGTVRGYNGTIALCSPIPFDITCKPKAEPLVRAIGSCTDTVSLSLTAAGRLSVKSGKFKAFIDCVDGETPHVMPSGEMCEIHGEAVLAALRAVEPFIGEDAAKPWSNGVLFNGPSVFATNNVILVEYWAQRTLPIVVNIPRAAVRELLRIGEPPVRAQWDANSVTFHYDGDRWLRTQLLPDNWPDLGRVLNVQSSVAPLDPAVFDGLRYLKPFADKLNRVRFSAGNMQTHTTAEEGSSYELESVTHDGIFNIDMLASLEGVAEKIDFSLYPKPCPFFGGALRGAIIGMRE